MINRRYTVNIICIILINVVIISSLSTYSFGLEAFDNMLHITVLELVILSILNWGRLGQEMPKESSEYLNLGGIIGGIVGLMAFNQDSNISSSSMFMIELPAYLMLGFGMGAETGLIIYSGLKRATLNSTDEIKSIINN